MSDAPLKVETFSSGSLTLDMALGGGFPRGRIVEIYGPEGSGKTTLALHALAEVQRQGGYAAFIDVEHALDPDFAKRIGVNVADLYICQPDCGETALAVVEDLILSSAFECIVVDSVAALASRVSIYAESNESLITSPHLGGDRR